jgi:hypothetical protein
MVISYDVCLKSPIKMVSNLIYGKYIYDFILKQYLVRKDNIYDRST